MNITDGYIKPTLPTFCWMTSSTRTSQPVLPRKPSSFSNRRGPALPSSSRARTPLDKICASTGRVARQSGFSYLPHTRFSPAAQGPGIVRSTALGLAVRMLASFFGGPIPDHNATRRAEYDSPSFAGFRVNNADHFQGLEDDPPLDGVVPSGYGLLMVPSVPRFFEDRNQRWHHASCQPLVAPPPDASRKWN